MSKAKSHRADWVCPVCDRTFRLPANSVRPSMCSECSAECDAAAVSPPDLPVPKSGPLSDMPTTGKKRRSATMSRTATRPDPPFRKPPPPLASQRSGEPEAPTDQDQIVEYLANISSSMTFFRRLVWGMVIVMILNVLVMGVGVIYAMQKISSSNGILNMPGNVQIPRPGGNGGGPAAPGGMAPPGGAAMEQIGEYARALEEATNEALNQ